MAPKNMGLFRAGLIAAVFVLRSAAGGYAAEIKTSEELPPAYNTSSSQTSASGSSRSAVSPYLKKIPGSTTAIQGGRSMSYLKPQNISYKEHMNSIRMKPFSGESSAFGHKTAKEMAAQRPQSIHAAAARPLSRLQIQQHIGRPASGMSRNQPLSDSDMLFIDKMAETMRAADPNLSAGLNSVIAGQKQGRTLTKDEYDLLNRMADHVHDGQAAYRLRSIAEKRKETLY